MLVSAEYVSNLDVQVRRSAILGFLHDQCFSRALEHHSLVGS